MKSEIDKTITCRNCDWHWKESETEEFDKYVCHKCGFDNSEFYQPKYGQGGGTGGADFSKVISASSRFKPSETIVFNPPVIGKNGAKLIAYTWSYEMTMKPNYEGELVSKRISDWTQAELSADTGRDIVHKYTVEMPDGEIKNVSSESVPILLGYIDRKQMKSFPNLVTASKTLAKQQMQLAILEAQEKEFKDLQDRFEKAKKPEVEYLEPSLDNFPTAHRFIIERHPEEINNYSFFRMGDIINRVDNPYNYSTKSHTVITKPNSYIISDLSSNWVSARIKENGGVYPQGLYDLRNRVQRQKRKVDEILKISNVMESGGQIKIDIYSPEQVASKILSISKKFKVSLKYVKEQLEIGTKVELEHSNKDLAVIIALDHLDEMPDYYERLSVIEHDIKNKNSANMKNGGELNYDSKGVKDYFAHSSGDVGGVLVGKRHSEGGIKAINKATGQPIEMEGGEVVITRNAVSDNSKREFEGKMLTNKEILSEINQGGGGVAIFKEGGDVSSHDEGGLTERQMQYQAASSSVHKMEHGGEIEDYDLDLNSKEKSVLSHFTDTHKIEVNKDTAKVLKRLEDKGVVYTTKNKDKDCVNVFITDYGKKVIGNPENIKYEEGGLTDCGCGKSYKKGGTTDTDDTDKKYFQGIDHKYKNQFEVNKAIEELITDVAANDLTPDEKNFIGYYAGYGGLEKYGAKGKGLLYEYYTPSEIAKKMWALAYKYGYKGGTVLEPSCGIGEFIKYAPDQSLVTGFEISKLSSKICSILYPNASISSNYFESLFISKNDSIKGKINGLKKYSLVIGNPPYGTFEGFYAGMGEKKYTKSNNYIDYFITRGLDLLEKDGLLIYIIGTEVAAGGVPFLQQPNNEFKSSIAEKADLVDAYRLPNGLFETTDVLTDIVVFKKK